jgi:spore coat protein U-like protein
MKLTYGALGASLLLGSILSSSVAFAATETQNMSVTATVTNNCSFTVGTLAFGAVESSDPNVKNASVNVTINCTADPTSSTLKVGNGLNWNAKTSQTNARAMLRTGAVNTVQADFLAYRLYSDSGRTIEIGDNGSATIPAYDASNDAVAVIYGQIPSAQAATTGSFTDTVLLTLTYEP